MFDEMTLKIHKLPSFIPMPNYYRWLILILESRVDNIKNLYEHYASPFHNGHYAWQALSREKKTRNWLARNFSQEIRCKKCEKFLGISLAIFTHFLNQIDQLSTPKKRRSSHPLLDCWSAWIIIHTNWLWLGIWSWNIFADVSFELACHWTYFSEKT